MNIWSGSDNELAAALTNCTELARKKGKLSKNYPVVVSGKPYVDAEAAYQYLKKRSMPRSDKELGDILVRWNDELMTDIICAKFLQYPALYMRVWELGGEEFLKNCSHFTGAKTTGFAAWEGKGTDSRFIRNLIDGYKRTIKFKKMLGPGLFNHT